VSTISYSVSLCLGAVKITSTLCAQSQILIKSYESMWLEVFLCVS
jgi:hypothetical protein